MTTTQQLTNRFKEVFLNGTWVANTNYKHILKDVSLKQANTKISSLNTIALLTFHINYYVAGVLNVFENGKLEISDKYSFDAPEISSEQDWQTRKNELFENAEKLAQHIEQLTAKELQQSFVDKKYGNYLRNINGIIEHSYYHLGQISLIKKMILENEY